MGDFSHWDFAEDFDAWEAAALILGIEPTDSHGDEARIRVVWRRMESDYGRALARCIEDYYDGPPWASFMAGACLYSNNVRRLERWGRMIASREGESPAGADLPGWWASHPEAREFENQRFARGNLASWLSQVGLTSAYAFVREASDKLQGAESAIDPADLPVELQAANIAFRAVFNGYGDASATFKNRLVAYLESHFVDLGAEAVKRIATVANPDKEPGRKRRSAE